METKDKLAQLRASEEKNRQSCEGCRHDLGGGRDNCKINVAYECRDGGGFELYEDAEPEEEDHRRGDMMREFRRKKGLTQRDAGKLCGCSGGLIKLLEDSDGNVTHPKIAARIAAVFGMTEEMALSLIPKNYRPGPDYDPERFVFKDPLEERALIRQERRKEGREDADE